MRHHAITWADGGFNHSVCILSFDCRAARAAYPAQCAQRFAPITHKQMRQYRRDGHRQVLMLWDEREPTQFRAVQGGAA